MDSENKENKKRLLATRLANQRELNRQQKEYKKVINAKFETRKESIADACFWKASKILKNERSNLRAQLWVANGVTHRRENEKRFKSLKCHVDYQNMLNSDIVALRLHMRVIESQLNCVYKTICDLNRETIPDNQHQAHVQKFRRAKEILQNQLDVGVRLNCACTASNQAYRQIVVRMLKFRSCFDDTYTKSIHQLRYDNKYLFTLIQHVVVTFENGTNWYEKIMGINSKESHDREMRKIEIQNITKKSVQNHQNFNFYATKDAKRDLCDLEPREYKRRNLVKQANIQKIGLYENALGRIRGPQKIPIEKVIENFKEQESIYYSYFSYTNEQNYHITLLNTSMNELFQLIDQTRTNKFYTEDNQFKRINLLEQKLEAQRKKNIDFEEKLNKTDKSLVEFLREVKDLIVTAQTPLPTPLNENFKVNIATTRNFLQILENRINQIVARVFSIQRRNPKINANNYVVKDVYRSIPKPLKIEETVVTQQCPECAEGEAVNADGTKCDIDPISTIKKKLHEKVVQPEMQYRLHNLSACRLQRSRMLANKVNEK